MTIEERFWAKADKTETCWNWNASLYLNGYAQFAIKGRKRSPAHRTAWELSFGPIPKGLWVLHKCDNRMCVNPGHLFLGTQQDNTNDMVEKRRHCHGERTWSNKLSENDVLTIRNLFTNGKTETELANSYHITQSSVSRIIRAVRWRSLGIKPIKHSNRQARGEGAGNAKLTADKVIQIRKLVSNGQTRAAVSRKFKVSGVLVGLIVKRKIWKHIQ